MKARETMIAWTRGGTAKAGPWPDSWGWSDDFDCTAGACWVRYHEDETTDPEIVQDLVKHLVLMLDCGLQPQSALNALDQIDEFREYASLAPSTWNDVQPTERSNTMKVYLAGRITA